MNTNNNAQGCLVARNLYKSYGLNKIVNGASLTVSRGEIIGLLGPNGAGKTTFFHMIIGLIRPDKGSIEIDGYPINNLEIYRRAKLGIGYLPQETSIFRGLTVAQNINSILELTISNKKDRLSELDKILNEFRLTDLTHQTAVSLSGGETRRVEIARTIAAKPKFILLDEPFSGIDPIAIEDLQILIKHLSNKNIGILITDHNVKNTMELVDRAYIIHGGQVLAEGSASEIVSKQIVKDVYLGRTFE